MSMLIWHLFSKTQINLEIPSNVFGLLRKPELYKYVRSRYHALLSKYSLDSQIVVTGHWVPVPDIP